MMDKVEEKDEVMEELEEQLKEVSESEDVKRYLKLTKLKTRLVSTGSAPAQAPGEKKPTPKKRTFF